MSEQRRKVSMDVECPWCGSPPGMGCIGKGGQFRSSHKQRAEMAREAAS